MGPGIGQKASYACCNWLCITNNEATSKPAFNQKEVVCWLVMPPSSTKMTCNSVPGILQAQGLVYIYMFFLELIRGTVDGEPFRCVKWYCLLPLCRTRGGLPRSSCCMWGVWSASLSTCPSRDVHWEYAVMSNQRWEDMFIDMYIVHQASSEGGGGGGVFGEGRE